MVDRLPSGTRDVLPDEMRELRAMTDRIRAVFERDGYGEVYTPALEYERATAGEGAGEIPSYHLFDEHGNVLTLRSDMTTPIARLAATRYATAEAPLRFCYFAHAYRVVRPQRGQSREFLQAGIELIGAAAPQGTAEALNVLADALTAAGLESFRIAMGDVSLYPALLDSLSVPVAARERVLTELAAGDYVGVERELERLDLPGDDAELLARVPRMRGGPELLEGLQGPLREAGTGMRAVYELLPASTADRLIFDFGLVKSLGYYTGAVFQVLDPAYGVPLGGGGRYDELLGRFGPPLPAVGFALNVERLHIALTGEEGESAGAELPGDGEAPGGF
jgi:ATP phosphoribosyltransferase regulatory subunit